MPGVVIRAQERSIVAYNAPAATDIAQALQSVSIGPNRGRWIGPAPRITRSIETGSMTAWVTNVAWLWGFPDNTDTATHYNEYVRALQGNVDYYLREVSSSFRASSAEPYAPAIHGSVDWWASGQAAQTRTVNEFPTSTGRLDPNENPRGPTTAETHPTSTTELGRAVTQSTTQVLIPLAVIAGAIVVLPYVLPKRRSS